MAALRVCLAVALILLGGGFGARAEDAPATPNGLYDRPVLVIDSGMHTATIWRAAADRDGRWAVTGSLDKTIRVWSLADGSLVRTIRMPAGPGNVGKVYAVAVSPGGTLIAAGGWTRWTDNDQQEQIYLFDRESGELKQRIEGLPSNVNHLAFSPDGTQPGRCVRRRWPTRLRRATPAGRRPPATKNTALLPMAPTSRPTDAWPLRRSTARFDFTRAIFGPRSGPDASLQRGAW